MALMPPQSRVEMKLSGQQECICPLAAVFIIQIFHSICRNPIPSEATLTVSLFSTYFHQTHRNIVILISLS